MPFPSPPPPAPIVADTRRAVDAALASTGYSCKAVSWDDVARSDVFGTLSTVGPNITDTYLKARCGTPLFTVRADNWNERLGVVSAGDVALLVGNCAPAGQLRRVTLRDFLADPGACGAGYAGLAPGTALGAAAADMRVSVRFQAAFLPVGGPAAGRGALQFAAEAHNHQTGSADDPRNLVLLATAQGLSVHADAPGAQRLLVHAGAPPATREYWLEAEASAHSVGGAQHESAEERADARRRGKATSEAIGVPAMGNRFNALMTIQIPLVQRPSLPLFGAPPPPSPPGSLFGPASLALSHAHPHYTGPAAGFCEVLSGSGAGSVGFGAQPSGFSVQSTGFAAEPSGFGAQSSGFGAQPSGFGAQSTGFGAQSTGFGAQPTSFGVQPSPFGAQPSGFGAQPTASAAQPTGFGAQPTGFGVQQRAPGSGPGLFGAQSGAPSGEPGGQGAALGAQPGEPDAAQPSPGASPTGEAAPGASAPAPDGAAGSGAGLGAAAGGAGAGGGSASAAFGAGAARAAAAEAGVGGGDAVAVFGPAAAAAAAAAREALTGRGGRGRGRASAARVSRGALHGRFRGLAVAAPVRDAAQHVTVTVVLYHAVAGGVPSAEDVLAAAADLDALYAACATQGQLADARFAFMKPGAATNGKLAKMPALLQPPLCFPPPAAPFPRPPAGRAAEAAIVLRKVAEIEAAVFLAAHPLLELRLLTFGAVGAGDMKEVLRAKFDEIAARVAGGDVHGAKARLPELKLLIQGALSLN